ncbi:MAG: sensor histidine kinase [Magnetovibrionaceae bacterium]
MSENPFKLIERQGQAPRSISVAREASDRPLPLRFAFVLAEDGRIETCIGDSTGRVAIAEGKTLASRLCPEDPGALALFLERLRQGERVEQAIFRGKADAPFQSFELSGAAINGRLVVTGDCLDMPGGQDVVPSLGGRRSAPVPSEHLLEDFMAINNELATTSRQLRKANMKLADLAKERELWTGALAHDLRAPLTVTQGYAAFLAGLSDSLNDDRVAEVASQIDVCMGYTISLVTNLLAFSQLESGTVKLNREPVDPGGLMKAACDLHRVQAETKGVGLTCEIPGPSRPLIADKTRLLEVLGNLISNGVKYTHPGGSVTLSCTSGPEALVFGVVDTGQGIRLDEQAQLFQPFQKTSVKPTAGETSTGLGLAICQKIIALHGGRIDLSSEPGEGTRVDVTLPSPPAGEEGVPTE